EWYHVNSYQGSEGQVTYTDPAFALGSAVLWADEYNTHNSTTLFGGAQSVTFTNPSELLSFSTHGATDYADAYTFITGSLGKVALTLSYGVIGGGTTYSPPVLSYTINGAQQTTSLTGTPTTYFADSGSSWQVSGALPGSTSTERWGTNELTTGTLTNSLTETIVYFHQFYTDFGYTVSGGGTGYSPPQVQCTEFGASFVLAGGASTWIDAGSSFSYGSSLAGSSSTERWVSLNASGTVTQSEKVVVPYFHQFGLTLSYALAGGGSPTAPRISGTQFGKAFSGSASNSSTFFLDPGTSWSVPALLPGSNSQERWISLQTTNGTVSGPVTLTVVYHHQYTLTVAAYPSAGGTTALSDSWEDAGGSVQVSQTASQGWKFEGWNGTGTGSYSGSSNSSSVMMNSPIAESATFYPGLQISAGANGAVSYGFGSQKGDVQSGSSLTVFAPAGTKVLLQANPSSFLYSFTGWTQGANETKSETSVVLDSPATVKAGFSLNTIVVGGIGAAVIAVIAVSVLALRARRRPGQLGLRNAVPSGMP
ncbi:MAG: hypothetical protein JRN08_09595, partial [Nitrososphaerota archaeon]|nr:hypothetical protein [Nitrososphaerota archaeon]